MNKKCVFTYITGDHDEIVEPLKVTPGWDYICFTDNPNVTSHTWDIRPLNENDLKVSCPKRRANSIVMKYYEYLTEDYDICICIDGNMQIKRNLDEFLERFGFDPEQYDFMLPNHPDRNCVYDEAKAIIDLRKDDKKTVENHVKILQEEKYPLKNGLYETCVLVLSRKSENLKNLFQHWYKNYMTLPSKRDQMSINYAIWKADFNVRILSHSGPPGSRGKERKAFNAYFEVMRTHKGKH